MIRFTMRSSVHALAASLALWLLAAALFSGSAAADPFDGKILTSDKRFPTAASSKSEYFSKLRKQSKTDFREDTKTKSWKIQFAAFFKKPLNDFEVTIKLYDDSERPRRLVASFEQYLDTRGQKNIISNITLEREKFGVNRSITMVVENRGRALATGKFKILGEAERYSGKVEFSSDEAASGEQAE